MRKLLLWLAMVIAMVALILGGTAAFLYSRTGEKDLPQEAVTFGDTALTPNGWDWTIPVLGDKVSKHYQSPTNLTVPWRVYEPPAARATGRAPHELDRFGSVRVLRVAGAGGGGALGVGAAYFLHSAHRGAR